MLCGTSGVWVLGESLRLCLEATHVHGLFSFPLSLVQELLRILLVALVGSTFVAPFAVVLKRLLVAKGELAVAVKLRIHSFLRVQLPLVSLPLVHIFY